LKFDLAQEERRAHLQSAGGSRLPGGPPVDQVRDVDVGRRVRPTVASIRSRSWPARPTEGQAARVFLAAGRLADDHDVGIEGAVTDHGGLGGLLERAALEAARRRPEEVRPAIAPAAARARGRRRSGLSLILARFGRGRCAGGGSSGMTRAAGGRTAGAAGLAAARAVTPCPQRARSLQAHVSAQNSASALKRETLRGLPRRGASRGPLTPSLVAAET